jgi:serine/threonine protein kinase/Tfp pilus assembly protein PilF
MTDPSPDAVIDEVLVGQIADEFTERVQRGERPDVEEYARRYPAVAGLLRQVLPALLAMAADASAEEPPAPDVLTGCLGDYRLGREVGRGGMGVVYEAVQLSLNRRVALKVLPFAAALDPRQLQRFKNESQAAAHLHHTHIVPVFGVGTDRGVHYYAMQFIEGESLAALIRQLRQAAGVAGDEPQVGTGSPAGGVFSDRSRPAQRGTAGPCTDSEAPPVRAPAADTCQAATTLVAPGPGRDAAYFRTVAHLGIQAAEALAHAHEMGVVHRDVKPGNLLVDVRGHLWVTDFGLALLHGGDAGLTLTGDLVGTLRYMSPEQASGRRCQVDHRTDIYSLGVTLYELLALHPAFAGRDRAEVLRRVVADEPVAPRRLNAAVPRELETVILKAMAKAPEDRYATAQELADDLQRFLDDRPIRARRPTWAQRGGRWMRRHRAVLWAVGVVGVVGLAACALLEWQASEAKEAAYRREAEERRRAEDGLRLAMRALDQVYFRATERWALHDPQREQEDRPLLKEALGFYKQFAERNRGNPGVQADTARAYQRVADLAYKLDQLGDSEGAYALAVERLGALVREHPDEANYRLDLAHCLSHYGVVLNQLHHPEESENVQRRALGLLQPLVAEQPRDRERRRALAFSYHCLGTCCMGVGRGGEAEKAYRQSLEIQEALCQEFPDTPDLQHDLAGTRANLGLVLWRLGRHEEAESSFEEALKGLKRLTTEYKDPFYRLQFGQTLDRMGGFYRETGRRAEAEVSYRGACTVMALLAKDYPGIRLYRVDLAAGRDHLANVVAEDGKLQEARELHAVAVADLRGLVKELPDFPYCRVALADACNNQANLLGLLGAFRAAEPGYREALALRMALAAEHPSVPEHRDRAAGACINLATVLRVTGRAPEAERELRLAATLSGELTHGFPAVVEYRHRLGTSQIALGLALENAGRPDEAEEALRSGMALEEALAARYPRVPDYQNWLARSNGALEVMLRRTGRAGDAEKAERRAVTGFEKLAADFPAVAEYREELATLYGERGARLREAGQTDEAERAFRVALAHADGLVAQAPGSPDYRRQQAACRCGLGETLEALGRYREAEESYRAAGQSDPRFAPAHNGLAWLLATCPDPSGRAPDRAVDAACKAVALAPNSGDCWNSLGVALFRAGDLGGARGALEKAVSLRPKVNPLDAFFLAMVCWRLGERQQATRWYEKACHLRPPRPATDELARFRVEAADLLGRRGIPPAPEP